eukprot:7343752-Karenia_brevis.AAC.1
MQFGCAKRRGTAFANHIVRSFIDTCKVKGLSAFILFLDLRKAFDYCIREVLLGWSHAQYGDKTAYLMRLGLSAENAEALRNDLDRNGGLLEQLCGVDICAIVNSLHSGSWFRYADLDT